MGGFNRIQVSISLVLTCCLVSCETPNDSDVAVAVAGLLSAPAEAPGNTIGQEALIQADLDSGEFPDNFVFQSSVECLPALVLRQRFPAKPIVGNELMTYVVSPYAPNDQWDAEKKIQDQVITAISHHIPLVSYPGVSSYYYNKIVLPAIDELDHKCEQESLQIEQNMLKEHALFQAKCQKLVGCNYYSRGLSNYGKGKCRESIRADSPGSKTYYRKPAYGNRQVFYRPRIDRIETGLGVIYFSSLCLKPSGSSGSGNYSIPDRSEELVGNPKFSGGADSIEIVR